MVTIKKASWHRNGVGGMGFYAILFSDDEQGENMIATFFNESGYMAVYNVDELSKQNIEFAQGNSFRGDYYEGKLVPLLEKYLEENGINKLGTFSI